MMSEELSTTCFEIITYVGTARSCFINAIQCAKQNDFTQAESLIKQGDEAFVQGHNAHADLLTKEANGELGSIGLLMLHAEDQLMSAESFRLIAEEVIDLYKKLS